MPKIAKVKLGDVIYDISDKSAVSVSPQNLTDAEKTQARSNIGAVASPATDGSEGQALVLDASGNPVWGDVAVSDATSTTAGIAKLYQDVNSTNEDGAPSQKAVNEAIEANKFGATVDESQELASFVQGMGTQIAGPTTAGAVKMFDTVNGENTDGTVTQKAINDALSQVQMTFDPTANELVIGTAS